MLFLERIKMKVNAVGSVLKHGYVLQLVVDRFKTNKTKYIFMQNSQLVEFIATGCGGGR